MEEKLSKSSSKLLEILRPQANIKSKPRVVYSATELRKLRSHHSEEDCPDSILSQFRSIISNRQLKKAESVSESRSKTSDKNDFPHQAPRERTTYEKRASANQSVKPGDRTMSSWRSKGENTPERVIENKKSWEPSVSNRFNANLNSNPMPSVLDSKNDMWDTPGTSTTNKKSSLNADEQRRLFEKERQEILAGRKRDSLTENSQEGSYHKESDDIMNVLVDETLESESEQFQTRRHYSVTDSPDILIPSPGDLGGGLLSGGAGPAQFSNSRSMTVAELMRVSSDHELTLATTRSNEQHLIGGLSYFNSNNNTATSILSDKSSLSLGYDSFSNEDAWVSSLIDTEMDTDILGQPITNNYSQYTGISTSSWKPTPDTLSVNEFKSSQLNSLLSTGIISSSDSGAGIAYNHNNENKFKNLDSLDNTTTSNSIAASFPIQNFNINDNIFPPSIPTAISSSVLPQAPTLSSSYPMSTFPGFPLQSSLPMSMPIAPALQPQFHYNPTLGMRPPLPPQSQPPIATGISHINSYGGIDTPSAMGLPFLASFQSFDATNKVHQSFLNNATSALYSYDSNNNNNNVSLGQQQDVPPSPAVVPVTPPTDKDKPMKSISLNSLFSAAFKSNSSGVVTEPIVPPPTGKDTTTDPLPVPSKSSSSTTSNSITSKPRLSGGGDKGRPKPMISNSSKMALAKLQQKNAIKTATDNSIVSNEISTTTATTTTSNTSVENKNENIQKSSSRNTNVTTNYKRSNNTNTISTTDLSQVKSIEPSLNNGNTTPPTVTATTTVKNTNISVTAAKGENSFNNNTNYNNVRKKPVPSQQPYPKQPQPQPPQLPSAPAASTVIQNTIPINKLAAATTSSTSTTPPLSVGRRIDVNALFARASIANSYQSSATTTTPLASSPSKSLQVNGNNSMKAGSPPPFPSSLATGVLQGVDKPNI